MQVQPRPVQESSLEAGPIEHFTPALLVKHRLQEQGLSPNTKEMSQNDRQQHPEISVYPNLSRCRIRQCTLARTKVTHHFLT
jgi:hypothetical protein